MDHYCENDTDDEVFVVRLVAGTLFHRRYSKAAKRDHGKEEIASEVGLLAP